MITQEQIRRARAKGKGQDFYFQKTLNQLLVGEAGLTFQAPGIPAAGAYDGSVGATQFIGDRAALSHASGLLTFNAAVAPEENFLTFIRGLNASSDPAGVAYLVDLLTEYSGFNGNSGGSEQITGSSTGDNDLPRYQDGEGVMIYGDVVTALGATSRGFTVRYTDQDGNTGTSVSINTVSSQAAINSIGNVGPFIPLAAGDRGAKSIQGATLAVGGTGSGTFALVLCKILATLRFELTSGLCEADFVNLQQMLPKLEADACPALIWCPSTTNTALFTLAGEALALDPDDLDA